MDFQVFHCHLGVGGLRQNPDPAGLVAVHVDIIQHGYGVELHRVPSPVCRLQVERVNALGYGAHWLSIGREQKIPGDKTPFLVYKEKIGLIQILLVKVSGIIY